MNTQFFGVTYLDPADFLANARLFGAGMALCGYNDGTDEAEMRLAGVLAAASRMIDAFTGKTYTPDNRIETLSVNLDTWRFAVNNPPVSKIVAARLRYAPDGFIELAPANIFINNQKNFCEVGASLIGASFLLSQTFSEITEPFIELTYRSLADIPANIRLACGFQTGHLINSGFVDQMLPPNFGKIEIGDMSINNKKGYRSTDESRAGSLSADAERLLLGEIRFAVS